MAATLNAILVVLLIIAALLFLILLVQLQHSGSSRQLLNLLLSQRQIPKDQF